MRFVESLRAGLSSLRHHGVVVGDVEHIRQSYNTLALGVEKRNARAPSRHS
jgi:hypothetical protein